MNGVFWEKYVNLLIPIVWLKHQSSDRPFLFAFLQMLQMIHKAKECHFRLFFTFIHLTFDSFLEYRMQESSIPRPPPIEKYVTERQKLGPWDKENTVKNKF